MNKIKIWETVFLYSWWIKKAETILERQYGKERYLLVEVYGEDEYSAFENCSEKELFKTKMDLINHLDKTT